MAASQHPEVDVEMDSTQAFVNHWRIFRMMGVHPPDSSTWWGRHYRTYSAVWNFFFHVILLISFVVNFLRSNSLETFCESLCVAMPHALYMLKMINVNRMRGQLLQSHRLLRRLDERLASDQERRFIDDGIDRSKFIFLQVGRGCATAIILGIIYVAMSSERTLIYPSWIPWNWSNGSTSVFLATATVHTTILAENALMVLTMSTYPGTYLILLSVHTKALAWRVARLGHNGRQTPEELHQRLIGCIRDHQTIVHLFKVLERSLSMTCFLQFFSTACTQCAICYFLIFERIGIMQFMNMLVLLVAFTVETLLLCYTAELVGQENDNLLAAVYSCNWLDQSGHFRRLLVLVLMRCQKPLIMVAGVVVPIRLHTFLMVCKGAYTMLTLLNEMRKDAFKN